MQSDLKPLVAIVGRPNVGKSTLFNRLIGRRSAIVSDVAGTTRDRVTADTTWAGHSFILVDTGGLELFPETDLWKQIKAQIHAAIDDADVIIMVVDCSVGVTPADRDVAQSLRRTRKRVILAANKADNDTRANSSLEFYELGMGDPIPISAYHNLGIGDLISNVVSSIDVRNEYTEPDADIRLAIVGRTNVGKSMLVNSITGSNRSIVTNIPGTTRDALDTLISHDGISALLIDTAGIRRRGSIEPGVERYSVLRAIRAIDRADVAILVMDASQLATGQDTHIAQFVLNAYKGIVIVVNKWDLAPELSLNKEDVLAKIRQKFKFIAYSPVCFTSALNETGVSDILNTAKNVYEEWTKGLPRYDLRRTVMNAVSDHPPSLTGKRSLKIYSVVQDHRGPPSFTFYVNRSEMVHFSYKRYLENALRAAYEFKGSPLRMRFKGRGER